jgi:hypothetical protein
MVLGRAPPKSRRDDSPAPVKKAPRTLPHSP